MYNQIIQFIFLFSFNFQSNINGLPLSKLPNRFSWIKKKKTLAQYVFMSFHIIRTHLLCTLNNNKLILAPCLENLIALTKIQI